MKLSRKDFLKLCTGAGVSLAAPAIRAQGAYPSHPIHLVVPFEAGGTTDVLARLLVSGWAGSLGGNIIIDNKPGASGNIGTNYVAHAAKNGETLLYGTISTFVLNAGLYKKLPFDPIKDFSFAGMVVQIPIVLVVSPQLGVHDFQGFVKLLKDHPGKYNFGSAGVGSSAHIACQLLLEMTGTQAVHVPYKGNIGALNAIISGDVAFGVSSIPSAEQLVKNGKLQALAAISAQRLAQFPDLPTTDELGLKGYDAYAWNAVAAPAGTPEPVMEKLNATLHQALQSPSLAQKLRNAGVVPLPDYTRVQTLDYVKRELAKWIPIVRKSGASLG